MKPKLKETQSEAKSIVVAPPAVDMVALERAGTGLQKALYGTRIVDDRTYVTVAEIFLKAKSFIKNVALEYTPGKDHAHKAHKWICEQEKKALSWFMEVEKVCEEKMGLYAEEHDTPKVEGVVPSEGYGFEIIDTTKIPHEFCTPDLKKIRAMVSAAKQEAEKMIPGIRVFKLMRFAGRSEE